jgi:predicted MPP superfamily phosphohydrolase
MKLTRRGFIRLALLGAVGITGGIGFRSSRHPELVHQIIKLPRLPEAFHGFKIGQITDIHAGPLVPPDLVRQGVDMIMSENPDMVVLTGDVISGATRILWTRYGGVRPRDMDACLKELSRLKPSLGVYAVLGNHDFWSGREQTARLVNGLESINVNLLRNQNIVLQKDGQSLYLAGVDDYWESSYSLPKSLKGIPDSDCVILLSHNPDVNEDMTATGTQVDFIISGHTHGGQIVLPVIGAPYLPSPFGQKYRAGLVRDGKRQTYVSRGLGVFFAPIRLNCPPEVTILTLRKT